MYTHLNHIQESITEFTSIFRTTSFFLDFLPLLTRQSPRHPTPSTVLCMYSELSPSHRSHYSTHLHIALGLPTIRTLSIWSSGRKLAPPRLNRDSILDPQARTSSASCAVVSLGRSAASEARGLDDAVGISFIASLGSPRRERRCALYI